MSSPQDPYGDQSGAPQGPPPEQPPPPYGASTGAPGPGQQGPGYPPYPQQSYQGYVAPRKALDLAKLVTIAAWVVLGLYAFDYLYWLTQADDYSGDFGDRFFGNMPRLATGVFYTGVLLAVGVWLNARQAGD